MIQINTEDRVNEISQIAAAENTLDPAESTPPERVLCYALRDLYKDYQAGRATAKACAAIKAQAVRQYELDRKEYVKASEVFQSHAQMWKDAEPAARAYAASQNRTAEGDALFEAFYRVPLKTQKEIWEGASQHD